VVSETDLRQGSNQLLAGHATPILWGRELLLSAPGCIANRALAHAQQPRQAPNEKARPATPCHRPRCSRLSRYHRSSLYRAGYAALPGKLQRLAVFVVSLTKGSEPGRRKLIAVLYADMVDYSRLISLDDAGTPERLWALRRNLIDPAIEEHGGKIVQTGGDSLLVFDSIGRRLVFRPRRMKARQVMNRRLRAGAGGATTDAAGGQGGH
jgi:hypothetical protein